MTERNLASTHAPQPTDIRISADEFSRDPKKYRALARAGNVVIVDDPEPGFTPYRGTGFIGRGQQEAGNVFGRKGPPARDALTIRRQQKDKANAARARLYSKKNRGAFLRG